MQKVSTNIIAIFRGGDWGTERLWDFPKVLQAINSAAGI